MADAPATIRVVVIDDSAYNRQTITQMLERDPTIRVVGRAGDGDEGLKQVFQHQPDVVTLDLEMPKMDGFTFLRILMSRRATPVIVVSSYAAKENVFKALELGALDFVAKPGRQISPDLRSIEEDLVQKVRLVRQLRAVTLGERAQAAAAEAARSLETGRQRRVTLQGLPPFAQPALGEPFRVCAIGASTGGPPALQQVLSTLEPTLPLAIAITQHMPAKFTQAFAARLGRSCGFSVKEAESGDVLGRGQVLVAPGGASLELVCQDDAVRAHIEPAGPQDRFVPSVDRLFTSAASVCGADLLAIVLTGMGGDGGQGVRAVKGAGGRVIAEAAETAIIFGMPQEAIATGSVDEVLPLSRIPQAIAKFASRK
jgi:two-component system chemotaxis response regulator CheB